MVNKIKRLKMKITSMFLLVALLTLEFSPFALKATANELQFYSAGAVSVGYDKVNGKNVFYGLSTKLGGIIAYCIDYTCGLPSGKMTFRDEMSDQGMAILMYGYPNSTPEQMGCNTVEEAYMATQMALWEVMNRTGESHKAGLIFRVDNIVVISGKVDFMNTAKAAAQRLVARAENEPYTQVPNLDVNTQSAALSYIGDDALMGPYVVTVTGATVRSITASLQGAPATARITDASGNTKTSISNGDSVYVRMDSSEQTTEFKLNFSTDVDRKVGLIYASGSATQDYAILDTVPNTVSQPITIKWTQTESRGRIELIKLDQDDQPVIGAKFRLEKEDGTSLGEVSTGTDGKIIFTRVPAGKYKLVEVEAPTGYVIKTQTTNVTVVAGETSNVTVRNERITGKLVITKIDDANKPLANVTFEIYDSEGYLYDTVVTNSEGKASVNLDYGKYFFKETIGPEGHIMDDTLYTFTVDGDNRTFYKTVTNERYKGTIVIVKTDSDNEPIEGVKFNILDSEGKLVKEIVTNDKGLAGLTNLPLGTYYYEETYAPENVIMDSTRREFKLETQNQVLRVDVINQKIKGALKITKVDDANKPIANVKFQILDSNKNVIETLTTDNNGIAISSQLNPGNYFYKEIEAPSQYILDTTERAFEIDNSLTMKAVKVVNNTAKGSLEITKYDSNGNTLEGVKFNILDENENVVDTIVTDKNGKASSKELPLGTYYYQETEAPDYVVMDEEMHAFVLSENGQIVKKTVINNTSKGKLTIVKVDENDNPLAGVTFDILDMDKKVIDTIVTDENGKATSKELEKGTYYYQETKAPEGIIIDSNYYEFTIEYDGQNVIENMINYYITGQLKVYKIINGTKTPLAGVKFQILDANKEVVEIIETDDKGIAMSGKLMYGTYYFQEIEAPEEYIMDSTEYEFKVDKADDLIEAIVYNTKREIPKTGGLLSDNLVIVLAVSIISILGYSIVQLVAVKKENE